MTVYDTIDEDSKSSMPKLTIEKVRRSTVPLLDRYLLTA